MAARLLAVFAVCFVVGFVLFALLTALGAPAWVALLCCCVVGWFIGGVL